MVLVDESTQEYSTFQCWNNAFSTHLHLDDFIIDSNYGNAISQFSVLVWSATTQCHRSFQIYFAILEPQNVQELIIHTKSWSTICFNLWLFSWVHRRKTSRNGIHNTLYVFWVSSLWRKIDSKIPAHTSLISVGRLSFVDINTLSRMRTNNIYFYYWRKINWSCPLSEFLICVF